MKKRKIKRSPLDIVDRCIDLQAKLDEHRRFLGDLLIILCKPGVEHKAIKHDIEMADFIWDKIHDIISENRNLKEKLAQFSHPGGQIPN